MTFSQTTLRNSKNKLAYAARLVSLLLQELKNKSRADWKINLRYWYRSYIKFESVCPVCAEVYNGGLTWGDDWCRHSEAGGSGLIKILGMKMAASEFDAKSEALLEHDTEQAMARGEVQTAADLKRFANESGWTGSHDEKLIKKIQQRHRLR